MAVEAHDRTFPRTKVCKKCSTRKPRSQFNAHSRSADKLQAWCRSCQADYNRTAQPAQPAPTAGKVCKACDTEKPFSDYGAHAYTSDKLQPNCRACKGDAMRKAREKRGKAQPEATAPVEAAQPAQLEKVVRARGEAAQLADRPFTRPVKVVQPPAQPEPTGEVEKALRQEFRGTILELAAMLSEAKAATARAELERTQADERAEAQLRRALQAEAEVARLKDELWVLNELLAEYDKERQEAKAAEASAVEVAQPESTGTVEPAAQPVEPAQPEEPQAPLGNPATGAGAAGGGGAQEAAATVPFAPGGDPGGRPRRARDRRARGGASEGAQPQGGQDALADHGGATGLPGGDGRPVGELEPLGGTPDGAQYDRRDDPPRPVAPDEVALQLNSGEWLFVPGVPARCKEELGQAMVALCQYMPGREACDLSRWAVELITAEFPKDGAGQDLAFKAFTKLARDPVHAGEPLEKMAKYQQGITNKTRAVRLGKLRFLYELKPTEGGAAIHLVRVGYRKDVYLKEAGLARPVNKH